MATIVVACGGSGSNSSQSTSTSTSPMRTACSALAANGLVFTAARPGVPFTVLLPELEGWRAIPSARSDDDLVVQRTDTHGGRTSDATVTLRVSTPYPAATAPSRVFGMTGNWRQWRTEAIQVCGRAGNRAGGILVASEAGEADLYREYIDFDYVAGEMLYPIHMLVRTTAAARDTYQPDIDTLLDGLQVVPAPRAS
ncbi:hypothetical protein [Nocardia sp. NPDC004722]